MVCCLSGAPSADIKAIAKTSIPEYGQLLCAGMGRARSQLANRVAEKFDKSIRDSGAVVICPVISCPITLAVAGATRIPSRKYPVATKYPAVGVGPRIS